MTAAALPSGADDDLQRRLYDEHRIEAVARPWNGRPLLRASFQGYNDERHLERLLTALRAEL